MSTEPLETVAELARTLERATASEAAKSLTEWVRRRDQMVSEEERDSMASAIEVLSAEFHREAEIIPDERSVGLDLAAAVLTDTAAGVRVGDTFTPTIQGHPSEGSRYR